jgi:hypothetical protein
MMEGACSTHGSDEKGIPKFGWKISRKRPFVRPRCRWEDNIRIDLGFTMYNGVDWVHLAQKSPMVSSCEHSNESSDSIKDGEILDYVSDCFSRRTLLHVLS